MHPASGAACSLPPDGLRERLELLAEIGANLLEREDEGGRHVLIFRAGAETRRSLERIVAAERECCSFLDLAIREEPGRVVLTVEADGDGALVAAGFAAAFDPDS
jgi:hypothetical protein